MYFFFNCATGAIFVENRNFAHTCTETDPFFLIISHVENDRKHNKTSQGMNAHLAQSPSSSSGGILGTTHDISTPSTTHSKACCGRGISPVIGALLTFAVFFVFAFLFGTVIYLMYKRDHDMHEQQQQQLHTFSKKDLVSGGSGIKGGAAKGAVVKKAVKDAAAKDAAAASPAPTRHILLVYMPGCPACVRFSPTWLAWKAQSAKNNESMIRIDEIDGVANPGVMETYRLQYFPSVIKLVNNKVVDEYDVMQNMDNVQNLDKWARS